MEELSRLVAAHVPGYRVESIRRREGLDHVAYELNGDLIVRVAKAPGSTARAAAVEREARLLGAVAQLSPLPVPEPRFVVPERGVLAYPKLPGAPLIDRAPQERRALANAVARDLGLLLAALHAAPVEPLAGLVERDHLPMGEWQREAREHYERVAPELPASHRPPVEAFLAAAPPDGAYAPVFSHNDLGIEHVLVGGRPATVTGIIDWSDAAIADPAVDFALLYRDLGPAALERALDAYRSCGRDAGDIRRRAGFYARCGLLEDLAYGAGTGRSPYVEKSLAALEWLFRPS